MKRYKLTRYEWLFDNVYDMPVVNKKMLGLIKYENNSIIMCVFIGLKSKMYVIKIDYKSDTNKAKVITNNYVKPKINVNDYLECFFNYKSIIAIFFHCIN